MDEVLKTQELCSPTVTHHYKQIFRNTCGQDNLWSPLGSNSQQDKADILQLHLGHQWHYHMYQQGRLSLVSHQDNSNPMNITLMVVLEMCQILYRHSLLDSQCRQWLISCCRYHDHKAVALHFSCWHHNNVQLGILCNWLQNPSCKTHLGNQWVSL